MKLYGLVWRILHASYTHLHDGGRDYAQYMILDYMYNLWRLLTPPQEEFAGLHPAKVSSNSLFDASRKASNHAQKSYVLGGLQLQT